MVSPRAAERMLDAALAGVNVSRTDVTPRQMRALVAGPVQRDLRRILPPEGSKQVVERVMERLRAMSGTADPSAAPSTPAPAAPTPSEPLPSAPPPSDLTPARNVPTQAPTQAITQTRTQTRLATLDLDDAAVEHIALSFARLDDVVGVSVVRRGRVRFHRGEGIEADVAATLVPAAANAFRQRGPWRSYTLEHDRGHLFIVPVGDDHLVVVGRTDFNLGAVLTALATLEEEL